MAYRYAALLCALSGMGTTVHAQAPIRTFDFRRYLNEEMAATGECEKVAGQDLVVIDTVEYFDFGRDGRDEALVTASTCMTGTAGPDIHAVYRMDDAGQVHEIEVIGSPSASPIIGPRLDSAGTRNSSREAPPSAPSVRIIGTPLGLIGNRNWQIGVDSGRLSYRFYDGSGRDNPLQWLFELRDGRFHLAEIIYGPVYHTSFDCARARSDREIAACGNEALAKLDVELDRTYRHALTGLDRDARPSLVEEQRAWLQSVEHQTVYKDCCEQYTIPYSKRIEQLKQTAGAVPSR